jgi:hypothetical protein
MGIYNTWTEEHDEFLRANAHRGAGDIAYDLKRSSMAVRCRASKLKIKLAITPRKKGKRSHPYRVANCSPWSPSDLETLRAAHGKKSATEVAEEINRTNPAVRAMAIKIGVKLLKSKPLGWEEPIHEGEGATREECAYVSVRRASIWHLVDLKRAGHSPSRTELRLAR